ncbi:MAG: RNA polymerase subunit sigma-70 [Polyangiaceae bacterium]
MPGEGERLEAARAGDEGAFRALAEPHRRGLLAHCYRMSGSLQEAEELVQDAMLRAWRGLPGFEGRSSFKTWLYRIATHAALDAQKAASVRRLPAGEGEPTPPDTTGAPVLEPVWLEPFPDALLPDEAPSPDASLSQRQSVGFAFLQALQRLPPTQRAALLLKEVVGSSAAEVAELLDTTTPAVNSLLQRARTTLGEAPPPEPADERHEPLLRAYLQAFESANVGDLVNLLRDDARLSMPPVPSWYLGVDAIAAWLGQNVLRPEAAGRFRGSLTRANGRPAVALHARGEDGVFRLLGVHVIEVVDGRIADVVAFMDPTVLRFFDLPAEI